MAKENETLNVFHSVLDDDDILNKLKPAEVMWRDKQPFLASQGYHLRPRYHPGWVPSWVKDPSLYYAECPDFASLPFREGQIDATTNDGRPVYLKVVQTDSNELNIANMFSQPPLRDLPQNHCVPESLFPDGHHPVYPVIRADMRCRSRNYIRLEAPTPVRYLFIDFGLSSHIPTGQSNLVVGVDGLDEEVPELSSTVPYDAFKVEIFTVGNVFCRNIHDHFYRVGFLQPLFHDMIQANPADRPNAEQVLARWQRIRAQIWFFHRFCRLRDRREYSVASVARDIYAMVKLGYLLSKQLAMWSQAWLRFLFWF